MTDNDLLKEAKKFEHCQEYEHCNADGIIEGLLELTEENEIKANHRHLDLQQVCDDQSKLIVRLEAAYLKAETDRRKHLSVGWRCPDEPELTWDESRQMARESLERIKRGDTK